MHRPRYENGTSSSTSNYRSDSSSHRNNGNDYSSSRPSRDRPSNGYSSSNQYARENRRDYGTGNSSSNTNNGRSYTSNGGRDFGTNGSSYGSNDYRPRDKYENDIQLQKPSFDKLSLKPIIKNIYKEQSSVVNRLPEELDKFLNVNNIVVTGERFISPIFSFDECAFPQVIMNEVLKQHFIKPTCIQSMSWPTLLSGYNLVGIAQTGSGKTLGFTLPLIMHILANNSAEDLKYRSDSSPLGLILAPTRELAQQIQKVCDDFGSLMSIRNVCVYGGSPKGAQIGQLRRGAEIIIATPGRLLDFMKDGIISLSKCTYLVLDEADRMLDMGFEPQIRKIIEQIRSDRQTAMFSATWPKEVRKLAEDFLSSYIHIAIGAQELSANPNIKQIIHVCDEHDKEYRLRQVLQEIMSNRESKCIMFAETKRKVDEYNRLIRSMGYHCLCIHGDKKQQEREWVLNEFKRETKSILVATDVAARGLNITDIKFVVNIDYPNQTEDYVHRIGRTGRSSNTGTAYTFLTSDNARHVPKLIDVLREAKQHVSDELIALGKMSHLPSSRSRKPMKNSYSNNGFGDNQARKRDSNEMNSYESNHHHHHHHHNEQQFRIGRDGAPRVKKARWDNPGQSNSSYDMPSTSFNYQQIQQPLINNGLF